MPISLSTAVRALACSILSVAALSTHAQTRATVPPVSVASLSVHAQRPEVAAPVTATVGGNWVQQSPAASPSGRYSAAMAYDYAHGNVVLFGGVASGSVSADTWTWDGSTWTKQSPATSPAASYGGAMAYDAARGNIVLFGGLLSSGGTLGTWTWDGTNWTQQSPAHIPPARTGAAMAFDAATGTVVLFGGATANSGPYLSDTWTWNGTDWTQQSPSNVPSARDLAAASYFPANGTVVLFGGYNGSTTKFGDTWTWDGNNWNQQSPATSPAARYGAPSAYDPLTGSVLLFGGFGNGSGSQNLNDLWSWNGNTWSQFATAASPAARLRSSAAYDAATGGFVMFGGSAAPYYADTWNFTGTAFLAPTAPVSTAAAQTPVYFTVTAAGTLPSLSNSNVVTQGTTNLDFTLGTVPSSNPCQGAVTLGEVCSVNVAFTPRIPGQRLGAVNLFNSSGAVIASALISGAGSGPLATFTPGAISTVAAGLCYPTGVAADAAGDLYIAGNCSHSILKVAAGTGSISTVAGNGASTSAGDGGPATAASINDPLEVAVDGAGNLYIVDYEDNRVRKVTAATGFISTVAGSGTAAFGGDGGPATSASLYNPSGIAVDGAGNIYIADETNSRIRKVTVATGYISTVAGNGNSGYTGSQDNGTTPATATALDDPQGVAVDGAGNLYIADTGNGRIRKVNAVTGDISTVAGNGGYGYNGSQDTGTTPATATSLADPKSVAVDGAGNLYISDTINLRIRKVTAATGFISTVAGNGSYGYNGSQDTGTTPATATSLNYARGVAVDSAGNLYIADENNKRIRKVTATAAPLAFANTAIGSSSATQTLTVNNVGTAPLTFPIPGTGQNPSLSNFFTMGNTSTCITLTSASSNSVSLAGGASCTDVLSYSPTIDGSVTGSLIFTDNSLNATNATQTVVESGSTTSGLTISVIGQNVPQDTASITLEFIVGYGGNPAPTGAATLTVDGSATNVGTIACTTKAGHNNCTATYDPSTLAPGSYTISATQPADSNYAATSATGSLTITQVNFGPVHVGPIATTPITRTPVVTKRLAAIR